MNRANPEGVWITIFEQHPIQKTEEGAAKKVARKLSKAMLVKRACTLWVAEIIKGF